MFVLIKRGKPNGLSLLAFLSLCMSGCSEKQEMPELAPEQKRDFREMLNENKGIYAKRPLNCDVARTPGRDVNSLLYAHGHIGSTEILAPLDEATVRGRGQVDSQFDPEDRAELAIFYGDFDRVTRSANRSIDTRNRQALAADFTNAIGLLERWGRSGLRQKYCGFCSGSIRPEIRELPVTIAFRSFIINNDREEFSRNISRYLISFERINNISAPKSPEPPPDTSPRARFHDRFGDEFWQADMHYALAIYYMMRSDDKNSGNAWKSMVIGNLATESNRAGPMADEEYELIDDLGSIYNTPFDIVKKRRIDTKKYNVCSSLYQKYLEYLVLQGIYDPRFIADRSKLAHRARQFEEIADPKLFSVPMKTMLRDLIKPEAPER